MNKLVVSDTFRVARVFLFLNFYLFWSFMYLLAQSDPHSVAIHSLHSLHTQRPHKRYDTSAKVHTDTDLLVSIEDSPSSLRYPAVNLIRRPRYHTYGAGDWHRQKQMWLRQDPFFVAQAAPDSIDYCWANTCIDKFAPQELQTAIVSVFR